MMGKVTLRPATAEDLPLLEDWRKRYFGPEPEFELPFGWVNEGVETAVANVHGQPLSALCASRSVHLGPFVRREDASNIDLATSMYALDRAVLYNARCGGAVDAYLSAHKDDTHWHQVLQNLGYTPLPADRLWFWRSLKT